MIFRGIFCYAIFYTSIPKEKIMKGGILVEKKLMEYLEKNEDGILKTWEALNSMPEIAFKEIRTSDFLAKELLACGYDVITGVGGTGVIGNFDTGKPGPKVGIRADMDSLAHEIDGKLVNIHSCGHDANCATVLWAAKALMACKAWTQGSFLVLFQPAEETLKGAEACIKSGKLDDLEYLIGTHLRPMEELAKGKISPAVLHGASGAMDIEILGESAHGARPQQGVNAIETAATVINAVMGIHVDPTIPHSMKPTQIHSGRNAFNVIPDRVELTYDLRAQSNEAMEEQKAKMINAVKSSALAFNATANCNWRGGVPAAQPSIELIAYAKKAIEHVMGKEGLADTIMTSGGEDFHKYPIAIPKLKSTVLGVGADLIPGLHKPNMQFDKSVLLTSAKVMSVLVNMIFRKN